MATRIYLPSSGNAPVTPSTWNFPNQINPLTFAGALQRIGSTLTTKQEATGTTSPTFRAMLRYVIGPLAAQSISGTVNLVMRAYESSTGANATMAIAVKIIKPDGSDRAVLLAYTASDSATSPYEFTTTLSSRRAYNASEQRPIPLTSQSAQHGDYLVIEIGFRSATTTSRNIQLRYGDAASSDLADGEGETNDYNPWCEFSQDITFLETKSGSFTLSNPSAAISAAKKSAKASVSQSIAIGSLILGLLGVFGSASISESPSLAATGIKYEAGEEHYGSFAISSASPTTAIEGLRGAKDSLLLETGAAKICTGAKSAKSSASVASQAEVSTQATKKVSGTAEISVSAAATYQSSKHSGSPLSISGPAPDATGTGEKTAITEFQIAESAAINKAGSKEARGEPSIEERVSVQNYGQKSTAGSALFEASPEAQAAAISHRFASILIELSEQIGIEGKRPAEGEVSISVEEPSAEAQGKKSAWDLALVAEPLDLGFEAKKHAQSDLPDLSIGSSVSATGTSAEVKTGSLSISEAIGAEAEGLKAAKETVELKGAEAESVSGKKAAYWEFVASVPPASLIYGQKETAGDLSVFVGSGFLALGFPSFEFHQGSFMLATRADISATGRSLAPKGISRRDLWIEPEQEALLLKHDRGLIGRIHPRGLIMEEE